MKLTNVTPYVIKTPPPHWGGGTWFFLKLETDDGIEGWGETAVLGTLSGLEDSYEKLVQQVFDAYLKGADPIDREPMYHKLYEGLTAQHPDYVTMGIISAFDVALWDICGKHYDTPVYNLLGGKYRDRVRSYTYIYDTVNQSGPGDTIRAWTGNPERMGELAGQARRRGIHRTEIRPAAAVQVPDRCPRRRGRSPLRSTTMPRRPIGGGSRSRGQPGRHPHRHPRPDHAVLRSAPGRPVEKYDPLWLEEPCPPENYKEMGEIADSTSDPHCHRGEAGHCVRVPEPVRARAPAPLRSRIWAAAAASRRARRSPLWLRRITC